ncbi:HAD family phosphatase [Actinomadura craniellae]|uniref:HAD family phosphatase n=2 Tax=Actinomadura craniellae TaxID=2231787 RepID=A0A365H502_9ACTN|nr:HAD family phosphatase [Actinomadura craniellae]
MDGLLIDSERLWFEAETETMAWLAARPGSRWPGGWGPEHQAHLVGGSLARTVAYMLDLAGPVAPPGAVGELLLAGMSARLRVHVPLRPGAGELLAEVRAAGLPCALVSSTHRSVMDHVLAGVGRDSFTVTLAGDEVGNPKPHPEPYLTAARRLGADPRRCVALEDSPSGLAAAEAAGCPTVAVPSVVPIPPAPGRTVVGSLHEVDLRRLGGLVAVGP